jgi:acetoacetate decarboxylase
MAPDLHGEAVMKETDILTLSSMPIASPSYPMGPYRFIDREYMIITYESDPEAIRDALPVPLEPDGSNTVLYEFIKMPDSAGFGDYTESGVVIPALYKGEHVNFAAQMYLDDEPPISGGREIWGFPKKLGNPKLEVIHDTLTGRLHYADVLVAVGTMSYKHEDIMCDVSNHYICDSRAIAEKMSGTQVNLKLIPDIDGSIAIAQLVAYNLIDIQVKGAWSGHARLQLHAHVNAPVADLPVRKALHGLHFIADLTLPYGRILYDYKKRA